MGYLPNYLIWMIYIAVFIFGLIIGSFLNVVIYRVPRNQSIINPPSHCPKCNTKLKWDDMIPLLSYIILKGKCRYCGTKISFQY
ncbi:MAG: prepilin peptidase, partial [Caldiserica bacterium CG17_big_fil_post_rev_8_21_14_2_50_35_7]